jgi:hypothetical protein
MMRAWTIALGCLVAFVAVTLVGMVIFGAVLFSFNPSHQVTHNGS